LPVFLLFLAARGRHQGVGRGAWFRAVFVIGLGVAVGVLAGRVAGEYAFGWSWSANYYKTHARVDALFTGVALGCWRYYYGASFLKCARLWPLLLPLAVAPFVLPYFFPVGESRFISTFGFSALSVGSGLLVLLAGAYPSFGHKGPPGFYLVTRVLSFLGVYSYTIYLFHAILHEIPGVTDLRRALVGLGSTSGALMFLVWVDRIAFLALSILGGILLAHLVERPVLRWRDRRWPGHTKAQVLTAPGGETGNCRRARRGHGHPPCPATSPLKN
jgi:peptidoglycan/LPS O-acetylase OafA/YrhL